MCPVIDRIGPCGSGCSARLRSPKGAGRSRWPGGRPAVVLLSGGLDSATVLAMAHAEGYRVNALSFRYGQRHAVELAAVPRSDLIFSRMVSS